MSMPKYKKTLLSIELMVPYYWSKEEIPGLIEDALTRVYGFADPDITILGHEKTIEYSPEK